MSFIETKDQNYENIGFQAIFLKHNIMSATKKIEVSLTNLE